MHFIVRDFPTNEERERRRREKRKRLNAAKMDLYNNRIHYTNRGELVRSKSEMIIANLLAQNEIPYEYEKALWLGNKRIHPDFTIELDFETYYWERCMMMRTAVLMEWNYSVR